MDTPESELIEQARGGDIEAFARLVERHRRPALRLAYALVGPDAEDVTQEALVKAFRHLDQFRHGAGFRPWLLAIVANEARNGYRSTARRSALALRAASRRTIADATPEEADYSWAPPFILKQISKRWQDETTRREALELELEEEGRSDEGEVVGDVT